MERKKKKEKKGSISDKMKKWQSIGKAEAHHMLNEEKSRRLFIFIFLFLKFFKIIAVSLVTNIVTHHDGHVLFCHFCAFDIVFSCCFFFFFFVNN